MKAGRIAPLCTLGVIVLLGFFFIGSSYPGYSYSYYPRYGAGSAGWSYSNYGYYPAYSSYYSPSYYSSSYYSPSYYSPSYYPSPAYGGSGGIFLRFG